MSPIKSISPIRHMHHLSFTPTPIIVTPNRLADYKLGGVKFKRDDLFLKAGGGSKARMLQYILADVSEYDVLVTAGGPCSNFNRACALQCAELGIPMHLVTYTDHPHEFATSNNFFICKLADVRMTRCEKTMVAQTIQDVVESYRREGLKVKSVYGGGRSVEGIYAYYDAVKELMSQIPQGETLDKVFVACGTGTTVAGILAGFQEFSPSTEIHAISVARQESAEMPVIEENLKMLGSYLDKNFDTRNLRFHDEFILGEYGATNDDLTEFIHRFISATGILVDPIYSGKALWGMGKVLESAPMSNMLFWHTGAIYTLMSNRMKFAL